MGMKAIFLNGADEATAQGRLFQWDRGRTLEIHADDLPAAVEVHFAHAGMDAAIVYTCAVVNGVATVAIPNLCLQQSGPVKAWVYQVGTSGETETGETIKTITLPLTARTRPDSDESVPEEFISKYTEAMAAMDAIVAEVTATTDAKVAEVTATTDAMVNEVDEHVEALTNGDIVAKRAESVYKDGVTMFAAPTFGAKLPSKGFYMLMVVSTAPGTSETVYNRQTVVYWNGASVSISAPVAISSTSSDAFDGYYFYRVDADGTLRYYKSRMGTSTEITDQTILWSRIG